MQRQLWFSKMRHVTKEKESVKVEEEDVSVPANMPLLHIWTDEEVLLRKTGKESCNCKTSTAREGAFCPFTSFHEWPRKDHAGQYSTLMCMY